MEAAFRGNEAMAAALLAHGAKDDGSTKRDLGGGNVVGPYCAREWAAFRGNLRLGRLITYYRGHRAGGDAFEPGTSAAADLTAGAFAFAFDDYGKDGAACARDALFYHSRLVKTNITPFSI
jgi:hypothetical protein